MNLVMFDIDGTLTNTNEVDQHCYVQALSEILQVEVRDTDWTEYENVTDQGCLEEFVRRNMGRSVMQEESASIKKRYIELVTHHADNRPELFTPIPDAVEMFVDLQREPEVTVSIASGALLETAKLKLTAAGFSYNRIPMATGSDGISREEIMMLAEKKAAQLVGINSFRTRTYIGDAPWDLQAAHNLGYSFIGIGEGAHAQALRSGGAMGVFPDYKTRERFFELLRAIWGV